MKDRPTFPSFYQLTASSQDIALRSVYLGAFGEMPTPMKDGLMYLFKMLKNYIYILLHFAPDVNKKNKKSCFVSL